MDAKTDAEIRKSMTSEQIQLERKLTCEAIDGAIAFGRQNTNPPPGDDHWLAPFWKIGRQQAELEALASISDAAQAPDDLDELKRAMCVVGVVGQIDGHDVIRRGSALDVIEQRMLRAAPVCPTAAAPSMLTDEGMIHRPDLARENLAVWYGPMPESNGKTNWTAILHNGDIATGITLDRSEYPDRVRYEADRARWLIGELVEEPFILDYDADKHSGYVKPAAPTPTVAADAAAPSEPAKISDAQLNEAIRAAEKKLDIVWFVPDDSETFAWRTTNTDERSKFARALVDALQGAAQ
ncbi:hypothetical protein PWR63_23455 [Paraburkholderia sp. A2WS-5]|uniref:hypothetical protein n=1 Tax=Paraburkholderia sp. A2WS-5 TaxID=3028372 RepID=UPI003B7AB5E2